MGGVQSMGWVKEIMAASWYVDHVGSGYALIAPIERWGKPHLIKIARGPNEYLEAIAKEHNGLSLVPTLRDVRAAFRPLRDRDGVRNLPIPFWLDMLQAQIDEAREHVANGKPEKALAEIADCFSVGWQALSDNVPGEDAEAFIVNRVRTRIIPRAAELAARDLPKVRCIQEDST